MTSGSAGAGSDRRVGEAGFGLVEALVSALILSVGLLAVGGIALSVATQTRSAAVKTDQALAAQQVLEDMVTRDFQTVLSMTGDTTLTLGGRTYTVSRSVTEISAVYAEIEIVVAGADRLGPDTVVTFVHNRRDL